MALNDCCCTQPSPRLPGSGAGSAHPSPRVQQLALPAAAAAKRSSSEALTDLYAAAIDDAVAASRKQSAEDLSREVAATRLVGFRNFNLYYKALLGFDVMM